jgi:arylsulfatase A-like enzyme
MNRRIRAHAVQLGTLVVSLAGAGACSGNKEASATSAERDNGKTPGESVAPSVRSQLTSHRPLLDEVVRADVDMGGLKIDFGTPAQHKYTRGGWLTGWGKSGQAGELTWVTLTSRRGFLDLAAPLSAPVAVVVRARSGTAGQQLAFYVGDRALGSAKLGAEWSTVRVPVEAGAIPRDGRFRFEVRASERDTGGVRAEIDWLWLSSGEGEPAKDAAVVPLAIGTTTRRALVAPAAGTYSFYLQPPPGAQLVVDLGTADHAEFVVAATVDGAGRTELLRETVDKKWIERAIPLAAYAGRAIRIDLTTRGQRGAAGWGEPEIMVAGPAAAPSPQGTPPRNVIVLVMDTMRADAFAAFAGPNQVAKTPSFDALAARSTVFAAAYDNENWTKPSVATTLSGLYPSTHDTKQDESKLPDDVELISERLRGDGFATAGFVANGYVSDKFGFEQGWDVFRNYIRESKSSEAEHVFGDALAWHAAHAKQAAAKPFFLYLQTIDPHVSYRVDREYWSPHFEGDYHGPLGPSIDATDQVKLSTKKLPQTATDVAWLRALYWGEVGYHDAQLGRFLQELEARGVLKDTLLVITNDHGEELGERGRFGHGHQVFEELIRAPLLVHYPPMFPAGKVIADVVEHVDVAPTILDALGRDPLREADGNSLIPLVRGLPVRQPRYAVIEFLGGRRVLRVGNWKLFARAGGDAALFDLAADPREEQDVVATSPIARRLCEVHLGEGLATPDKATRMQGLGGRRQFRAGSADIDPQMRRQLEALGYFGSGPKPGDDDAKD